MGPRLSLTEYGTIHDNYLKNNNSLRMFYTYTRSHKWDSVRILNTSRSDKISKKKNNKMEVVETFIFHPMNSKN